MNSLLFLYQADAAVKQLPEWKLWAVIIPALLLLLFLTKKMVRAVGKRKAKDSRSTRAPAT